MMDIPPDRPSFLRELINELHVKFRLQVRFLEALVEEAAHASGAAIIPMAAAVGGDAIEGDEPIAIEGDEPTAIEDDKLIVIEDDEPVVGTKDKPIVIEDDE